jgi:hypothetical protein
MGRIDWYEVRTRYAPAALEFLKRYGVFIGIGVVAIIVVSLVYVSLPPEKIAPKLTIVKPPEGFALTSTMLQDGQRMPQRYTADGADVSPPFDILNIPEGTAEMALICEDPDAPGGEPWVHWVLYRIPTTTTGLPEDVPRTESLTNPPEALQGLNGWGEIGYRGPSPPAGSGTHRYRFVLMALSKPLDRRVKPGMTKAELMRLIGSNVLETTEFVVKYAR